MREQCDCLCVDCKRWKVNCFCEDICEVDETGQTLGVRECQWFERKGRA